MTQASVEIDRFIERRSRQREKANEEADMWAESERRYCERRRLENRQG